MSKVSRMASRRWLWVGVLWGLSAGPLSAQLEIGTDPSFTYFSALRSMYDGAYPDAFEGFRADMRGARRTVEGRWYSAICHYAMMGECHYAMGNMAQALDQYNAALSLLASSPGWLGRVTFPVAPSPAQRTLMIPWSPADRTSMPGDFGREMQVLIGRLDNSDVVQRGGVVVPPEYRSLNVAEVVRCICVALRRRVELLGPLAPHDPMSTSVLTAVENAGGPTNHWSQVWGDVQYGLALSAMGKFGEAAAALQRSVLINGNLTHPLSGMALFELGRLHAKEEKYQQAEQFFLQASVAAAEFEQIALVEEALHHASVVHVFHDRQAILPELQVATVWARQQKWRHLASSLLTDSVENLSALGRFDEAAIALAEARKMRHRRSGFSVQLVARQEHQAALLAYRTRQLPAASQSLAAAIAAQRSTSPRLFQMELASTWFLRRAESSSRAASQWFEELLREPRADDWIRETLDTLTIELAPHFPALEDWLELSLERGEIEKAVWISDKIRRHRFYATLPMGGRLLSLRWILEAPTERMSEECGQRRIDLMSRFPEYVEVSQRLTQLRRELAAAQKTAERAVPEADKEAVEALATRQRQLFIEMERLAEQQELIMGEIALRREPIPYAFPPLGQVAAIQKSLPATTAMLVFAETRHGVHAFLISSESLLHWRVANRNEVRGELARLLKSLGLVGEAGALSERLLAGSAWVPSATALDETLIGKAQYNAFERFQEIVVVPDGILWYLPFELLEYAHRQGMRDAAPGTDRATRIRYLPMTGLLTQPVSPSHRFAATNVVAGSLAPGEAKEVVAGRIAELREVVDGVRVLDPLLSSPTGIARSVWDRLLVLDDISDARAGNWDWSPGRLDKGKPLGSMGRWLQVPWGSPAEILLPGFRSAVDGSFRGSADGSEISQAILGLMAAGSQTVLVSRWRTGGQSCCDLMREYLQESGQAEPSAAWFRSQEIIRAGEVDPEWEPRVKSGSSAESIPTSHPFFWSGFILADQGVRGTPSEDVAVTEEAPEDATRE